jgi:lipid II:glycine glycyltransferase (peptidoglycan interpeptide bridge formation enzyme)
MGDQLKIWVASDQGVPVASILTLRFKRMLMYKYGCADPRFFGLGVMQMLLWQAIKQGKESGLLELDLGRSDCNSEGLIAFKDRLGATRSYIS